MNQELGPDWFTVTNEGTGIDSSASKLGQHNRVVMNSKIRNDRVEHIDCEPMGNLHGPLF
jgi:hypothetical protein